MIVVPRYRDWFIPCCVGLCAFGFIQWIDALLPSVVALQLTVLKEELVLGAVVDEIPALSEDAVLAVPVDREAFFQSLEFGCLLKKKDQPSVQVFPVCVLAHTLPASQCTKLHEKEKKKKFCFHERSNADAHFSDELILFAQKQSSLSDSPYG